MMTSSEVRAELELFEFKRGRHAQVRALARLLPDVETALFFGKAMELDYNELGALLQKLFHTSAITALFGGSAEHSTSLQDYIVDVVPPDVIRQNTRLNFKKDVAHAEILPEMWEQIDVVVADSLKTVASKLAGVLDALPGKGGEMTFKHMAKLNKQRPTIGTFEASIVHKHLGKNAVVLDVSGSMTAETVSAIANDVVQLGYKADATLMIVSNEAHMWEPGTYGVEDVLREATYGGTHYETLAPAFDEDWNTVITIADYDSSPSARQWVRANSKGRINTLLDLSLVNQPTFLAEVLGELADEVRPLLVGNSGYVLGSRRY